MPRCFPLLTISSVICNSPLAPSLCRSDAFIRAAFIRRLSVTASRFSSIDVIGHVPVNTPSILTSVTDKGLRQLIGNVPLGGQKLIVTSYLFYMVRSFLLHDAIL